jgi:hypothetical protein
MSLLSKAAFSVVDLDQNPGTFGYLQRAEFGLSHKLLSPDCAHHDGPIVAIGLALCNQWLFSLLNVPF